METSPYLVAIGASADGLGAISTVLRGLPRAFPAPVLVVLHRRGSGPLATILARKTGLPVTEPSAVEVIQPGHVYVAPSDVHLVVNDGHVELRRSEKVAFSRPSVDVLFESVAQVYGPRAIGVLLSGGGRDGAKGLQAIRASGGLTVVQDPGDARIPYMPKAAIEADGIDWTLRLDQIGPALGEIVLSRPAAAAPIPVDREDAAGSS